LGEKRGAIENSGSSCPPVRQEMGLPQVQAHSQRRLSQDALRRCFLQTLRLQDIQAEIERAKIKGCGSEVK